jgi:multiple sugar transport system ATP-binding protein
MAGVVLRGITKRFPGPGGVVAIDGLDLEIIDGEFFALLGPSGCGKTTLLRTIAGLEAPTAGTIEIGGRDVTQLPPGGRDVAMVFQDYALYPHMTVVDNIAYPLKIKRVGKGERRRLAAETGDSLQLAGTMERRPAQLSGGQQQRVALARAVAYRPSVFLFDEPLSNLDARLRLEARGFLKRLQRELGITTVYVTHDQSEALALADRMAVMEAGRIRQLGTPVEVFHRPANLFVASFIGSTPMNLLPSRVAGGALAVGPARLPLPHGAAAHVHDGDEVVLGARPEYTALHPAGAGSPGGIAGRVAILEHLGTAYLVSVEAEGLTVQVTVPEGAAPAVGARVVATPDPARALLYRKADGELVSAAASAQSQAESEPASTA